MVYTVLTELADLYELLALADKTYGPYYRQDGRQIVVVIDENGIRRTVSYPKYLVEQSLGRRLDPDLETIDHVDGDINNNDLLNLNIVPRNEHSALDTRRVKNLQFNCAECGTEFERSPRLIRDKSKKNKSGPFCSRKCSGRYSRKLQLGQMDKLPIQPFVESEYYKRKNVQAFIEYVIAKYGVE